MVHSALASSIAERTWRVNRLDAGGEQRFRNPFEELSEKVPLGFSSLLVPPMSEVTRILSALDQGDPNAAAQLLPLVYDELRQLAAQKLAHEKPGQTLDATALVHEAYLRLVGDQQFASRRHFFAAAAEAMRHILIDNARRKQTARHGGGRRRVPLDELSCVRASPDGLLALDDALARFAAEEPAKAELVKVRFFAGMSTPEAAAVLGISLASAERWWAFARTWLYADLAAAE
jgi:RNA polymerase sigma factor (TIGR02999 family)